MEEALNIICYILSTLLGLAVGSFLNVCIYRLPRGKFFENSRSYCPRCGAPIKAYDNIPLLSYIILGGKCRACKEHISLRYPVIEALNMVLWIVNYAVFGMNYITIVYDILVSTLIVVAMVDYDTTEIPDSSIITIILLGAITFIPIFDMSWQSKLIGAFCISVPMFIIALFGGMGYGDVKLYFALGLLFGWEKMIIVFMASFVLGAIGGITNMLIIRHRKETGGEAYYKANRGPYTSNEQLAVDESDTPNIANNEATEDADGTANEEKFVHIESNQRSLMANDDNSTFAGGENTLAGGENDEQLVSIDLNTEDDKDAEFEKKLDENLSTGRALPFGPFIVIAGLVVLYFGDMIVGFYKGLLGL